MPKLETRRCWSCHPCTRTLWIKSRGDRSACARLTRVSYVRGFLSNLSIKSLVLTLPLIAGLPKRSLCTRESFIFSLTTLNHQRRWVQKQRLERMSDGFSSWNTTSVIFFRTTFFRTSAKEDRTANRESNHPHWMSSSRLTRLQTQNQVEGTSVSARLMKATLEL